MVITLFRIEQAPLIQERRQDYTVLLNETLGNVPWKVSRSHSKLYFRTNHEHLQKDLENLYEQQWFTSATKSVQTSIKLFNGFTGTWVTLIYRFKQSTGENELDSNENTQLNELCTNDSIQLNAAPFFFFLFLLFF